MYKTRIWMQPVDAVASFRPSETASRALATGFMNPSPHSNSRSPTFYMSDGQSLLNSRAMHQPVSGSHLGTLGEHSRQGGAHVENSLRSCPPSAAGTHPTHPAPPQSAGYYGTSVPAAPVPLYRNMGQGMQGGHGLDNNNKGNRNQLAAGYSQQPYGPTYRSANY